ncbi:MAG TPA: aldo/keto reductase [Propionibacteriaceae bacterium]|jgi:2,5-diketo-D-gluconate reductase A|nr:aldo/keto reductase [Propionibacteriaceae bacterium]
MSAVPSLVMNNGLHIPQLGFGVFLVPPEETKQAVAEALKAGYRLIDTAQGYRNEEGVGAAIAESDVSRDELFITTKLTNSQHGYDTTLAAFDGSMEKLGIDGLDLFLIHWPLPMFDEYVETWRAFEKLLADGRVRSIGVSNFEIPHLERLFAETDVTPAVNQIELHPEFPQEELREFHQEHGILTESWGPLGQGKGLLENPHIVEVARRKGRTPAQVVLRWHVQLGCVVIPKSVHPDRIQENIDLFDFELDDGDMAEISKVRTGQRLGADPNVFAMR